MVPTSKPICCGCGAYRKTIDRHHIARLLTPLQVRHGAANADSGRLAGFPGPALWACNALKSGEDANYDTIHFTSYPVLQFRL
jgi:hypothetical protein